MFFDFEKAFNDGNNFYNQLNLDILYENNDNNENFNEYDNNDNDNADFE